jgi:hypothetical protein
MISCIDTDVVPLLSHHRDVLQAFLKVCVSLEGIASLLSKTRGRLLTYEGAVTGEAEMARF